MQKRKVSCTFKRERFLIVEIQERIYPLIATCKRLHADPFAYLRDIFERISSHPKKRLGELLPDEWLAARGAANS